MRGGLTILRNWLTGWGLIAIFSSAIVVGSLEARTSEKYATSAVEAQLLTAQQGIAPEASTVSAGLYLKLGDGWKTYWRSPGEVGFPPEIDWTASTNVSDVKMLWPAPERFTAFGIENFGYHDEVLFPLQVTLEQAGEPVELAVDVKLLTCSEICVPQEFSLSVMLNGDLDRDDYASQLIAEYVSKVPEVENLELAKAFVDENFTALVIEAVSPKPFSAPDIFPELGAGTALGKPDIRLSKGGTHLWAKIPILSLNLAAYSEPLITITDGNRALSFEPEILKTPPAAPFTVAQSAPNFSEIIWIAAIAFLGGLILNAMPCVLPVLSIKVSSVLKADARDRAEIRIGFLFSALGVLVFMWVLAAVLLVLKVAGLNVGWGLQFQNPLFVAIMFFVLTGFAANLFGLFEIVLPTAISAHLTGNGSRQGKYASDFFTGLFGAGVATPCSAPFLGTAIAFALAGRGGEILIVFTSMGLGLSLPYLVFASYPGAIGFLPKPGKWMITLKAILGFLLGVTAIWLLFVLSGLLGDDVAVAIAIGSVPILFMATRSRWVIASAMLVIAVIGIALQPLAETERTETEQISWVKFERAQIAKLVSQGNTVFVDVTADWCLTCKANKALVLEREPVLSTLNSTEVIAMQADWTQPDKRIGEFLEGHGRYAIPFNAVFGPSSPEGIILPEILTATSVLSAIETAGLQSQ